MAKAHIEWGDDGNCDWGVTPLDERNYSCQVSGDGLHDWGGFDRGLCFCVDGGIMHTYCIECSATYEDCPG